MSFPEQFVALRNHLMTMPNRPKTIWDNVELPASTPFLIAEMVPLTADLASLARKLRFTGIFQVTVVTKQGIGADDSWQIGQRVADHFPPGWSHGGLRVEQPAEMVAGYPDNGLWRMPVQIRWRKLPV